MSPDFRQYDFIDSTQRIQASLGFPGTCPDGKPKGASASYGVAFLDDALGGMEDDELVLIGAPSGVGKTQMGMDIALENSSRGQRVAMAALEASNGEIEERRKFFHFVNRYYRDPFRHPYSGEINFRSFRSGKLISIFEKYRDEVFDVLVNEFKNFRVLYKLKDFTVDSLLSFKDEALAWGAKLLIIDHIHYFDYNLESESQALTEIIKAARDITQVDKIPLVMLSHLRKKSLMDKSLLRGIDDFHGSSNIPRNATTTIILTPGVYDFMTNVAETYIQVHKDRSGTDARYVVGKCFYSIKTKSYSKNYRVGVVNSNEWSELPSFQRPAWAREASETEE